MQNLSGVLVPSSGPYDVVAMLSGGKDSILMLYDLLSSHPNFRVLCVTYDDGFLSLEAWHNVDLVCHYFQLDSLHTSYNCLSFLEKYLESDLVRTIDIYTFLEVMQNVFWGRIHRLAESLGHLPVITGNHGYYSSEILLPEQYKQSHDFLTGLGVPVQTVEVDFISYWAEEAFPQDLSILDCIGWKSAPNRNTEHERIRQLRESLNKQFPKRTLDDVIDEQWEVLTQPRFSVRS